MPLPKRRHSSTRQAKRRTHYKITTTPTLAVCQRCKAMARAHHICPECGYYNGRQWLTPKTRATEE
jgi:large subunit ribosomal protein L32